MCFLLPEGWRKILLTYFSYICRLFNGTVSATEVTEWNNDCEWRSGKDWGGNHKWPAFTHSNQRNLSVFQCPIQDLNHVPSKYKSEVLTIRLTETNFVGISNFSSWYTNIHNYVCIYFFPVQNLLFLAQHIFLCEWCVMIDTSKINNLYCTVGLLPDILLVSLTKIVNILQIIMKRYIITHKINITYFIVVFWYFCL